MTQRPAAQLLPEPEPREVKYTFISADDHLVEPPDLFEGRLAAKYRDAAPRVVEDGKGWQVWQFEGRPYHATGFDAASGRPPETVKVEPCRYEHMRRGCWDIDARIRDMDINGVWASMSFPSQMTGFGGSLFSQAKDKALGFEVTRAYNDWVYDGWWQRYPERIIPLGITWLADPQLGAQEVRRNAARGFRALSLPERPHRMGFPSVFSGYWDPIVEACAETGTVINLHVGSSGHALMPEDAPMLQLGATLFGSLALTSCAEWLWTGYASRFPDVRFVMAEGGIGWVAMLIDRLDNIIHRSGYGKVWPDKLLPSEVLRRNFWFCTIDDPSTLSTRHAIGIDKIMLESDYPHGDSTWPDTQKVVEEFYGDFPLAEIHAMTHRNAAALYFHPLPDKIVP
jgi:predicted TIM-barrel fold metal-dependent hydrolase